MLSNPKLANDYFSTIYDDSAKTLPYSNLAVNSQFVQKMSIPAQGIIKAPETHGSIRELMRDAVLHETHKVSLFGLIEVNPGLISAFTVTGILFVICLVIRLFIIPRFKMVPGKFQIILETLVGLFDNLSNYHVDP